MTEQKEKKVTAASYIISFYQVVGELTDNYAQYSNLVIELESKHGVNDKSMTEQEKYILQQSAQNARFNCHKAFIMYNTILKGIKKMPDKNLLNTYEKIKSEYIISRSTLEKYVILVNLALIEDVIKNLLETSQDVIKNVYD